MSEFIELLSPEALKNLQTANAELVVMVKAIGTINNAKLLTPSGSDAEIKKLNDAYQQQDKIIQGLQAQLLKLANVKTQYNAKTSEEIVNQRKLAQNADLLATANSKLVGAYKNLSASHTKAKQTLQDLVAEGRKANQSQSAYNATLRTAQNEFNILDKRIKKADAAVGNFSRNVGNYKSALSGVSQLMGAFGISTGLFLGANIVKDIYETTKALQSMDLALKMVSNTDLEYAKNKEFVTSVSEKWGLEIKDLTKTYTQFYTASKGLLTEDSIKTTFEGIAKAGAVMGLSLESQNAAFYAFDQMMSKGTVTAEELKKQLGNAMPGAIKAAAMAYMDLHPAIKSIQEAEKGLYADMKKGAIDSATYVPLIAKNFQILYGIESLNSVHTMMAAQNRLKNSWTEWVRGLSSGNKSASVMVSLMESLAKNLGTAIDVLSLGIAGWLAYKTAVMLANVQTRLLALTTTTATVATAEQTVVTGFQTAAQVANAEATVVATTATRTFNSVMKANALGLIIAGLYLAYEAFNYFTKSVEETTSEVKDMNSAFISNREIATEAILSVSNLTSRYEELSNKTKLTKDEQLELNNVTKELAKIVPGAVIGVNQYGEALRLNTDTLKKYNVEKSKQLELERKSAITTERESIRKQVGDINAKIKNLANLKKYIGQGGVTQELIDSQELALSIAKQELMLSGGRLASLKGTTEAEKENAKAKIASTNAGKAALVKDVEWYDTQIKFLKDKEGALSDATGKEGKALQKQIKDLQTIRDKIAGDDPKKDNAGIKAHKKEEKDKEQARKNHFESLKSDLEKEQALTKSLIDNTQTSLAEKVELEQYYGDLEVQIAQLVHDEQVRLAKGSADLIKVADNKLAIDKISITKKMLDDIQKLFKDDAEKTANYYKEHPPIGIMDTPENKQDREDKARKDKEALEAKRKVFNEYVGAFADKSGFGDSFNFLTQLNKDSKTYFETINDASDNSREKQIANFMAITTVAQDAFNMIAEASQAKFKGEYDRLEKQKNIAIGFAGESDAAKKKIEDDYEKRRKAIAVREFKAKQKIAIMNIAIDTAQAIMQTLAKGGGFFASPLALIVAGMGAIQIAMVASQKVPAYWTGTDNAEAGAAWTQELGAEIITDSKGNIKDFGSNKGARLTMMEKGDKVFNAEETRRMMFDNDLNSIMMDNGIASPKVIVNAGVTPAQMREIMQDTLGGQTKQNISFDKNGFGTYVSKNGNITRRSEDRGNGIGLTL